MPVVCMRFFFLINLFIYLVLAVLGFCCCTDYSLVAVPRLLIVAAFLLVERGL